jgi:uncharacterized protein
MHDLTVALRAQIAADFGPHCVGHAMDHLERVSQLAAELREVEGGDGAVIEAACWLHDYHRVVEDEGDDDPAIVEARIRRALEQAGFPRTLVQDVLDCIAFTDRYSFSGHELTSPSLEARIVRDADNLDALGAVGIARAFMYGGKLREPLWVEGVSPRATYRSGPTSSVLHHFFEKLLRVRDDMLTPTGRAMADERHDYMIGFLTRLRREWDAPGLGDELARARLAAPLTSTR